MNTHIFMVWDDATTKSNRVHGVIEISEQELSAIIGEYVEDKLGINVSHTELRATTTSPESFDHDMVRLELPDYR